MAQSLPRKFKFNFTCCEKHGMARIVDVGLIPEIQETLMVRNKPNVVLRYFLGGGLG